MAPITHIVLFQFKSGVAVQTANDICAQMLALKENCKNPTTQQPYIKSMTGGKDHSPEGLQDGITHGFVAEFENLEDRDYYIYNDPVHEAFKATLKPVAEKVQVIDYTHNSF